MYDCKQRVELEGTLSDTCQITFGVPRVPTLDQFLIYMCMYINGLTLATQSKVHLFAVDAIVYSTVTNSETLQNDLPTARNLGVKS